MSQCPDEDSILDLLEGRLTSSTESTLRDHVDDCARCRTLLAELVRGSDAVPEPDDDELPVIHPASYKLEEEVGRGGLGTVLKARDRRLRRLVALKQLSVHDLVAQRRLRREALITARLQHPSIVPVYEAGRWPSGQLFYAMKLVSGKPLSQVIAETRSLDERLVLLPHVIAVAEAAAYAHSEGIIHRDLKPANVVIGPFAETVIIDWGLAKVLGEGDPDATPDPHSPDLVHDSLTVAGAVLGTPAYMPPEQARGAEVDERADVYAIGAILYHVLVGGAPFQGTTHEIIDKVISAGPMPIEKRQPGVPEDLAAIVRKAMAREPAARYPTAKELALDLERFQAGRLVSARRYSRSVLLGRWLWRHRLPVAAATTLLVTLAVGATLSVTSIRRARDVAEARRNDLILAQARAVLDHDPTGALAWLKTYPADATDQSKARLLGMDAVSRGVARSVRHMSGGTSIRFSYSRDGRFLAGGGKLWDLEHGTEHVLSGEMEQQWAVVAFSPDWLIVSGPGQGIGMWNLKTLARRQLGSDEGGAAAIAGLDLSPDGTTLASITEDGVVRVWDVASGAERRLGVGAKGTLVVRWAPDGKHFAVQAVDGSMRIWDPAGGTSQLLRAENVVGMRGWDWQADSRALIAGTDDGALHVWNVEGGTDRELLRDETYASVVARSPDGHFVASGWRTGKIAVTNLGDGTTRWLRGHTGHVMSLAFSPDGHSLASSSRDHEVRLWNLADGSSRSFRGHEDAVGHVAFSPDGQTLASRSHDGVLRLWPAREPVRVFPIPASIVTAADHSADGRWFATGTAHGELRVHDVATGVTRELGGHSQQVRIVGLSRDGRYLMSGSEDGEIRLWDVASGDGKVIGSIGSYPIRVDFSADGRYAAAAGATGGMLAVWSVADGKELWHRPLATDIGGLAFTPDGSGVAAGTDGGQLGLWDVHSGSERVLARGAPMSDVRVSPDGRLVAAAESPAVRLVDLASGQSRLLPGHDKHVIGLRFSDDGRWLASTGEDRTVWVWDPRSGSGRRLTGPERAVWDVAFSPDGKQLASGGWGDDVIWLWDLQLGQARRIVRVDGFAGLDFFFSADSQKLYSLGPRAIRILDLDPTIEAPQSGALRPWLDAQTDAQIGAEDRLE